MTIKTMGIKEFREQGYLQEVNRLFFHPLGLAISVDIDAVGNETLGVIWDYRDDPEGIIYHPSVVDTEKFRGNMERVAGFKHEMAKSRIEQLGYIIQSPKGDY